MNHTLQKMALVSAALLMAAPAMAKWAVTKNDTCIDAYSVSDPDTGRALNTAFKTEKSARQAAKALNKAEKKAKKNVDE